MADRDSATIGDLMRGVVDDARALIRQELALARAELREEFAAAQSVGIAFGAAAVLGLLGLIMLCVSIGGAIAWLFNAPAWVGYGAVALVLAGGTLLLVARGRTALSNVRMLPQTTESLRENLAWIQGTSSSR